MIFSSCTTTHEVLPNPNPEVFITLTLTLLVFLTISGGLDIKLYSPVGLEKGRLTL